MSYAFDWVDAFTDAPFGGNGCVVVHQAADLDARVCCNVVRETSLSECTFIGPSDVADVRVRYFLAGWEIPFAGHPTVATVMSMLDRGMIKGDRVLLETKAGVIPVDIVERAGQAPYAVMTQNAPEFGETVPRRRVAELYGLNKADIAHKPQVVSTGLPFCVTVVKDHDALRRAVMDLGALADLREWSSSGGTEIMEPFLVALGGATKQGDTFARLLLGPPSPPEDPFTGSATGCMAAYLWAHGLIDSPSFVAEQGHWMGRPGRAEVEVLGPRDAITGVRVGGQGRILMRGELLI